MNIRLVVYLGNLIKIRMKHNRHLDNYVKYLIKDYIVLYRENYDLDRVEYVYNGEEAVVTREDMVGALFDYIIEEGEVGEYIDLDELTTFNNSIRKHISAILFNRREAEITNEIKDYFILIESELIGSEILLIEFQVKGV